MRKLCYVTIGFAFLFYGVASYADDYGNSRDTAFQIPNNSISGTMYEINGFIDQPTTTGVYDSDYFKFYISTPTRVTALSISGTDLTGQIYDASGNSLFFNDDARLNPANSRDFAIRSGDINSASSDGTTTIYEGVTLQPGTYYIVVRGWSNYFGSYRLRIVGGDFYWSQGQAAVDLGDASDRMCYLTGVSGKFGGGGEKVQVYKAAGRWYMSGTSNQIQVQGWARCVKGTNIEVSGSKFPSYEYSWNQNYGGPTWMDIVKGGQYNSSTQLFNPGYSNCWLQGMIGKFSGGGEAIWILANPPVNGSFDGYYTLQGQSQQVSVGAWASCASTTYPVTPTLYAQAQGGYGQVMLKKMNALSGSKTSRNTCYLRSVTGKFMGGGEAVRIVSNGISWYLRVNSNQVGVGGSALCTDYM